MGFKPRSLAWLLLAITSLAHATDVPISGLPALTNADAVQADMLPIVDTTNSTTKSITLGQLDLRWLLASMVTGTGDAVLADSPTLVTPALGTPSAAVLTNATGLPLTSGVTGTLGTTNGGTGQTSLGTLSDGGTDGIVVTGGTGAVVTSASLAQHVADTTHNGYLSSTDWNTFTGKGAGSVTSVGQSVPAFLSISGSPVTTTGTLAIGLSGTALPIANGGTGATAATGTGNVVLANSPTLVTPALGTPASGVLTNATGLPLAAGVTGTLPVLNGGTGTTTSTGTGNVVLSSSPTLVTPALGTPGSGVATNLTGLPLTSGVTGTLPVANGGTGIATATLGSLLYANGTSPLSQTGAPGQYNVMVGSGSNLPSWSQVNLAQSAAVTGLLGGTNGGTGISSTATFPSSGTITTNTASQTLTNKTLTNPVQSSYEVFDEISTPGSAPASTTDYLYAKNGAFYYQNSTGVETPVGSGSGQSNYVQSGASTASGWTASSSAITCTTVETNLPDATIGTAFAVTGVSGSTAYCFQNFNLNNADANKQMAFTFDQLPVTYTASDFRIDMYYCSVAWTGSPATTCSGTTTRASLSTDTSSAVTALPKLTGTFRTAWGSPAAPTTSGYMQVRIGLNSSNTDQVNFANILVGPGVVTQGAAVGQWTSYTPVFSAGFGTVTNAAAWYRQVGTEMQLRIYGTTGTVAGSIATVSIPSFATIDTTVVHNAAGSSESMTVGTVAINGTTENPTTLVNNNAASNLLCFGDFVRSAGNTCETGTQAFASSANISIQAQIPIAQWAGSGTVNVSQNDLSYYFSTGNTWGTTNSSATTSQGPSGVAGGTSTPSGTSFTYTFTPSTPIPVGTKPTLRISSDQVHWSPLGASLTSISGIIENLRYDGTNYIGASVNLNNNGTLAVTFGKYAYGTTGAWNGTWYWGVDVGLPGQAVGFGNYQPGISSGLVSANGLLGGTPTSSTTTTWPISGNVGQYIENNQSGNQQSLTSGTPLVVDSGLGSPVGITLGVGSWDIQAIVSFNGNTGTTGTSMGVSIGTSPSSVSTGLDITRNTTELNVAFSAPVRCIIFTPVWRVNITSGTMTYYNWAQGTFAISTLAVSGTIRATRVPN